MTQINHYPKLHNATWPGIVGKGPDSEPVISLDQMLEMTAAAEVDGVKFDGVDVGLFDPHFDINSGKEGAKRLADKVAAHGLEIGSLVAPIWGGPAIGSKADQDTFVDMVKKSCEIGQTLREMGIRPNGIVRIDSASGVSDWAKDPVANSKKIVETFQRACDVAADYGERLAAEGEICWGGMHSWRHMVATLEAVDRKNIGFQADMSHTLLYTMGYNSPEDRILPEGYDWTDRDVLKDALRQITAALRPWTIDFHVAQNDGTVHGTGSHDKTGRHCQATDPNGKLVVAEDAGFWLRDEKGELTKAFKHICWDGCMFSNEVMLQQKTWNDILATMIKVRNAHGWS
ncbi:sugar phosphate isomerase/epimerase family protein [Aquirufa aurantiipilula]|uniref:TIM barrel protein n=1 Tax=Aquirufa aurantiipilula TaxID=2696561 RepID=A0ABT6BME9_9BACT|nr:TIM barrel protein [Aquirufa aurantiipilula]MBZ1327605.1 TIM barrel protein [Aquirufa aurantiipilula]MDF5691651.1 TIM barrel protein [Aquirufa aurantiipilula]